ncbi:Cmx/CmrA family chloramphenicol efflux MFS transporter [Nocardia sp. CC201C]|uniref:Cmx/CmrA family chloramphenicol efflux MFS transporter n=1 Tax=Nocardia sp. CC201C TaxID=3044575 RepID=UPI0024A7CCBD|nr:Cmx/CmrA family chloramphenicol efflux MFS transporter [Nocardia sp. CC201C]
MPVAVYILGLSIFAQGTSELMIAGLLTEMASDLGVSVPQVGLLISAFAVGMLLGAPILAVATLRWPRRTALLAFLAVFAAAHVLGALTSDYGVLFATRVVAAFVYAGFWSVAVATAVGLVADNARGRALSVVAGGLTVATVVGLPAGTVIGQHLGWRAAFWAVAVLSIAAMAGVIAKVPDVRPAVAPRVRTEVRALATLPVWLLYLTTALAISALMVTFGYLAAFLTETTGMAERWVPVVLAVYGIGSCLGIMVGGRTADAHPLRSLTVGIAGLTVTSALLALTAHHVVPVVLLVFLLGAFGFGVNPVLNSRVFTLAPGASTLGAAGNVGAFNVGITVGPWLGGLVLGAHWDYPALAWIGVALGAAALAVVGWSSALAARAVPAEGGAVLDAEPISVRA